MCDVRKVEIRRILKLTPDGVVPMKVRVPRQRMEFFQDDLFPNTRALQVRVYLFVQFFSNLLINTSLPALLPIGKMENRRLQFWKVSNRLI